MKKLWLKKKIEGKITFLNFVKKYSESIPHVPPDNFFEISPILKFQLLDRYWTYPFKGPSPSSFIGFAAKSWIFKFFRRLWIFMPLEPPLVRLKL